MISHLTLCKSSKATTSKRMKEYNFILYLPRSSATNKISRNLKNISSLHLMTIRKKVPITNSYPSNIFLFNNIILKKQKLKRNKRKKKKKQEKINYRKMAKLKEKMLRKLMELKFRKMLRSRLKIKKKKSTKSIALFS